MSKVNRWSVRKPGSRLDQMQKTRHQQLRADEQNQPERDLHDHESAPKSILPACDAAPLSFSAPAGESHPA